MKQHFPKSTLQRFAYDGKRVWERGGVIWRHCEPREAYQLLAHIVKPWLRDGPNWRRKQRRKERHDWRRLMERELATDLWSAETLADFEDECRTQAYEDWHNYIEFRLWQEELDDEYWNQMRCDEEEDYLWSFSK